MKSLFSLYSSIEISTDDDAAWALRDLEAIEDQLHRSFGIKIDEVDLETSTGLTSCYVNDRQKWPDNQLMYLWRREDSYFNGYKGKSRSMEGAAAAVQSAPRTGLLGTCKPH